jgi:hypothetical protein
MSETTSSRPGLSFRLGATWLTAILRVDQVRHDTLVSLVAHWGDDEAREDVILQLDALAEAVRSPRAEGELDALIERVEDAAAMDTAEVEVNIPEARRLFGELGSVTARLGRFRRHLLASPMPVQQDRRTA